MRHLRCWAGILFALVLLAACVDAPTAPGAAVPGGQNHDVLLDPVIVIGQPKKECDPWLDLNWCEDGGSRECIESDPGLDDPEYVGMTSCDDTGGGDPGGGTSPSPTQPPTAEQSDTCRTGEQVVDAPDVWTGFRELWIRSRLEGVEMGGWIVSDGTTFRLVPFQNANFTTCGIDIYESPPPGTVSLLHTHPSALFTANPCGYINTGTPSQEDIQALQQTGLSTGYFLDEGGIGKFTASGGDRAQRIIRCGY